jgi:carbon-monoxide dehydrogenase large subunit
MPMASAGEGGSAPGADHKKHSRHALSVDRVRYVGEPVAAVIGMDPATAVDAVMDVQVDWEPLPAAVDMLEARQDGSPCLFDDLPGNLERIWRRQTGDWAAAQRAADRTIHLRMTNQRLAGVPMEGRAIVAQPDPATGGLTVWTSTQAPHLTRSDLARTLRLPENLLRVIAPEVGGGFGLKIGIYPEEVVLAALAREHQWTLRWVETRMEHMLATTHGRAQVAELEAAVQADGTLTGLRMRVTADIGAYPLAPFIPELTGQMAIGVYAIPTVDIEIACVFTNTTPVAAYRGAGRPEATYYIERLMDRIAGELSLDPAEVRRKNFIPPAAFPYRTPTGQLYDSGEYDRALTKALANADYPTLRAEQAQRRAQQGERLVGIGLACYVEMCGFGPFESAQVKVEQSGTVTVTTGISPHGQGQETTFAQIIADQLGADYDKIVVIHGDTARTPMGVGTMGSRALAVGGEALVRAAAKVREKAIQIAAVMLEAAAPDVVFSEGRYQVRGVPDRSLSLRQIAKKAYTDQLPDDIEPGLEAVSYFKPPELTYPFGAHVAVVEVERETGVVHLRAYFAVDDCGPRISPLLVDGQVHGGLAQGISQALLEEVLYDENGQLISGSLMDYALPRAVHFPSFRLDKTETTTPHNSLGAKGIGEAATVGSTPAVVNAVLDALQPLGVRQIDMPLRPERVWRAMQAAGGAGA